MGSNPTPSAVSKAWHISTFKLEPKRGIRRFERSSAAGARHAQGHGAKLIEQSQEQTLLDNPTPSAVSKAWHISTFKLEPKRGIRRFERSSAAGARHAQGHGAKLIEQSQEQTLLDDPTPSAIVIVAGIGDAGLRLSGITDPGYNAVAIESALMN